MTTTKTKTATATPTTPTTFPDLVKLFSAIASDPDSDPIAYEKTLTDLATATVYCVVKKCVDPTRKGDPEKVSDSGYSPAVVKIRRDISADRHTTDNINRLMNDITYHTEYDKNGDPVSVCDDPDSEKALSDLIHNSTIGDGYDLVNDCIVAILTETEKQKDRDPEKPIDLERPYTVNRLKRKVYIKKADSVGGYETIETTPIQEVFKTVRRCIEKSRAIQTDPKNGYSYIEDLITSPDGDPDTIYYRLPKYADLGGYAKDSNGKETNYTAGSATVETAEKLIEKLNLTKRQATILQLRLKGYGYKAIATYIGTSADNVKGQIKELRRKAKNIDLTPEKFNYTPDSEKTPDPTPEKTPTAKRPRPTKTPEKIIISPVNIPVIPVHKDPDPVRIFAKRLYKPDGSFTFKYILHK